MRPLAVSFFFTVVTLGTAAVWAAYRLQTTHRQPYLAPFTLYVGFWSSLTLLSIVQYVLGGAFLPGGSLDAAVAAGSPLFATFLALALYFYSRFTAGLCGWRLSRAYSAAYAAVWGVVAIVLVARSQAPADTGGSWRMVPSLLLFLVKTLTIYGWIVFAWVRMGRMEDPLERRGRRGVVLAFLAGLLPFEGALRDVTGPLGVHSNDYVIGFLQIASVFPPLVWLRHFLTRRALARPLSAPGDGSRDALLQSGLSPREADVVELIVTGLSHKETAERLGISAETVKKHTYNAYRKLGVQNRVQLMYFVQRRAGSADTG